MDLRERAKGLRGEATEAERGMWYRLRDRRFMGLKFRRQVPLGRYIVDFLCSEMKLIVELDGGQHMEQAAYDQCRTQWLEGQGYRVLRFWNDQVLLEMEAVLESMQTWLEQQERPSPPAPLPQAGEGRQADRD
ncbi:endonuclease domain-containing protein [Pseudomonas sp. GV071]|uniref:endonuclease domain-containing protein n=1 Tax=Pseudomonas sp. GV071 TaxID=2135754 RepID=UPI000D498568|nr:endonuclease domain-containing protein [Pseudomonas sp. GV071]PTQ67715.1 very-short-patch-repair endonuclease [Pseudomonas sp. GV071]